MELQLAVHRRGSKSPVLDDMVLLLFDTKYDILSLLGILGVQHFVQARVARIFSTGITPFYQLVKFVLCRGHKTALSEVDIGVILLRIRRYHHANGVLYTGVIYMVLLKVRRFSERRYPTYFCYIRAGGWFAIVCTLIGDYLLRRWVVYNTANQSRTLTVALQKSVSLAAVSFCIEHGRGGGVGRSFVVLSMTLPVF